MSGPIARATLRTSLVLGLRLVSQALVLLLVARLLGPERYGTFAGVTAIAVTLGSLATFGTHLLVLREVSHAPQRRDAVLPFALGTTVLCGSCLFVAYLVFGELALSRDGIGMAVLVPIGLAELLVQPLLLLAAVEHQARERIARSQALANAASFLRLLAALVVWALHPRDVLHSYALGYLGAAVLALALGLGQLERAWPTWRHWRLPRRAEWIDSSGFAVLCLTRLGPTELDKALSLRFLPPAATGVYAAGARVMSAMIMPVVALMMSALPRLFRDNGQTPQHRLVRWIFAAAAGYGVVAAILVWSLAPYAGWLFGSGYATITGMLRWLSLAFPAMALRVAAGNALMARGRPWWRAGFEALGIGVLVVATAVLAPRSSLWGMPLALACAEWTMAVFGWCIVLQAPKQPISSGNGHEAG